MNVDDARIIEVLKRAIQLHRPVIFEYTQAEEPMGDRVGNPHVVYEGTTPSREEKIYLHMVQTGGVSKSIKQFPEWRLFFIDKISKIRISEDEPAFSIHDGYNPYSPMYSRAIIKI